MDIYSILLIKMNFAYLQVRPFRRSRPSTTTTNAKIVSNEDSTTIIQQKPTAPSTDKP
jgi:hypothetical protein